MVATQDVIEASTEPVEQAASPRSQYGRFLNWAGIAIVAVCCIYIFVQLQPRLLFLDTTPTGGDTGAHVWFPAYLRDHLLPWRVAGWTQDSYAGFPAGQFYFPFPALLIVLLDVVMPYNVAFKLVTALGPILLPIGAYVFARGIRTPRPAPALFAVGATAFVFFKDGGDSIMRYDHHIMGGTLTNTLAGEYSFTIAVACALLFLGTLAFALERRRGLWIPALFLAATLTSHLVVAVFALSAAGVIWLCSRPRSNTGRVAAIVAVGIALTAVWLVPLAAALGYTTDMRYSPIGQGYTDPWLLGRFGIELPTTFDWLFLSEMWFLFLFGLVAIGAGIAYRRRATLIVGAITVLSGTIFCGWELLRDILGKAPAWNLRLLPFWYLMLYLLAALGAAEIARWVGQFAAWVVHGPDVPDGDTGSLEAPALEETDVAPAQPRPESARHAATRLVAVGLVLAAFTTVALVRVNATKGYVTYWAKYNYTGYEGGSASDYTKKGYPEYRAFIETAKKLPPGRMFWQPSSAIGQYGTPLALMILPYWTNGRISSMEGLYYESAGTAAYHFLAAATLSMTPSNPVVGLPYRTSADFALGVRYLQLMGVRYYAVMPDMLELARRNPALRQVATVPDLTAGPPLGWTIFEVADAPVVSALPYEPVVASDLHTDPNWKCEDKPKPPPGTPGVEEFSAWECLAVPWFNDPDALDRPLTDEGPSAWKRSDMSDARQVAKRRLPTVKVSHIRTTEDSVEFDVSRTGVPVMVKTSYFPNWQAEGADGPWRATPNFMVVVPTSKHVRLSYGTSPAEWLGRFGTVAGLAGLGVLVWWGATTPTATGAADSGTDRRRRRVRFPSRSAR